MKITKRQLRRLIKEELSMINEGWLPTKKDWEIITNPPKTADEMMAWLEKEEVVQIGTWKYKIIEEWVNEQYANPAGFPLKVLKIISKIIFSGGADPGRRLLDYIKSSTGQT